MRHLFINYHIIYKQLYLTTASWFNQDTLITQYEVAKYTCNNKLHIYMDTAVQHATYYGICRMAMSKRGHILFFIKATQSRLYAYHLFTPMGARGTSVDNYL